MIKFIGRKTFYIHSNHVAAVENGITVAIYTIAKYQELFGGFENG